MNLYRWRTAIYTLCHFLVDLSCAALLFSRVGGRIGAGAMFLIYNFCAFAMQMPLGLLADRLNRNSLVAGAGMLLTAAAFLADGWPLVFLCGLGNALFHLGGGLDTLNFGCLEKKCAPLGVFVSSGALGIYIGRQPLSTPLLWSLPVILFALGVCLPLVRICVWKSLKSENMPLSLKAAAGAPRLLPWLCACLFAVVVLRSFVGMGAQFPWSRSGTAPLLLACCAVLGKAGGGFLADRVGLRIAGIASLGAACVLFLFASNPLCGLLAVLLFNMSMPLTLYALARFLPGAKGFTFGLLTFALFLGFLPVYLSGAALAQPLCAGLTLLSVLLLFPALKGEKEIC